MGDTDTSTNLQPSQAQDACPHCGGMLDLAALPRAIVDSAAIDHPLAAPIASRLRIQLSKGLMSRLFPLTTAISTSATAPKYSRPRDAYLSLTSRPRWRHIVTIVVPLIFLLLWAIGQAITLDKPELVSPPILSSPTAITPAHRITSSDEQTTLIALIAQYNAAEQQIATTLDLNVIHPIVDDTGPLWPRRLREIAAWKQAGTPHTTRLLQWSVGDIVINDAGTSATITTQETWEGQIGNTPPRTATVRVTYTFQRATAQATWRLFDTVSSVL